LCFDDCLGGRREKGQQNWGRRELKGKEKTGQAWLGGGVDVLTGWRLAESGEPSEPNKWTDTA
jgi:hypothetical protein